MSFGKILGVNLKVHYLFLLWLVAAATLGELSSALILVFSVIFHELGHILASVNLGVAVHEVELMPFGGVAKVNRLLGSEPATETAIALAGPANSVVLLVIGMIYSAQPWGRELMESNILLLLVNLLPIMPLDGGRILKGFLVSREGLGQGLRMLLKQTQRAAVALFCVSVVVVFFGVFSINALVLSAFILYAVAREKKMMPFVVMNYVGSKSGQAPSRPIMPAKALVVQPNTTIREVLDALTPGHYHFFTIVGTSDPITMGEDAVWKAMLQQGIDTTFADVHRN